MLDSLLQKYGDLAFVLPASCGKQVLHIVDVYKHLGSIITPSRSAVMDAKRKASGSMASYIKLVLGVLGSEMHTVNTNLR